MDLKIKAQNMFIVSNHDINRVSRLAQKKILERLREGSEIIKKDLQAVIKTQQSSGRVYRRKGRFHTASKPGYPPNEDTGELRRSFYSRKLPSKLEVRIGAFYGTGADKETYAEYLERGTKNKDGSLRMAARPFFYNTILKRVRRASFQKRIKQILFIVKNDIEGQLLRKKL